ncbi:MAG: AsmA-like C-terminal region-containing protein [Deltaproteobacteria bacterium]|nr:AsmA-like C-terminal region-containing protein [Deltaproteobacteria bacterium]
MPKRLPWMQMPSAAGARGPLVTRQRVIVVVGGVLSLLACWATMVVVTGDPAALVNRNRSRIEALAQKHLHRRLTLGHVESSWLPNLSVTIHGVELSGQTPDEPPMLSLPSLELRFRLWQAMRTLGHELVLEELRIDGGTLRVRRRSDGGIDVVDVLSRLPPMDPHDLEGNVLGALRVQHARLELIDETADLTGAPGVLPPTIALREVAITADDGELGQPLNARLTAQWERSEGAVVDVGVHVDEVPADLKLWPLPESQTRVRAQGIDAAALLSLFGVDVLGGRADLDALVVVDVDRHLQIQADLEATEVGSTVIGARAASATIGAVVDVDPFTYELPVGLLSLRSEVLTIDADLELDPRASQGVRSLLVVADATDLNGAVAMVPWVKDAKGLTLTGQAALLVDIDDDDAGLWLGLDRARVSIGEALAKSVGQKAHIGLVGTRSEDGIETQLHAEVPGGITIDGVTRLLGGDDETGARVSLDLKTGRVAVRRAASISPLLRDVLEGPARSGTVAATLRGDIFATSTDLDLRLVLRDLQLEQQGTSGRGVAVVDFGVFTGPAGLRLDLRVGLDDLDILVHDEQGELVAHKRSGVACAVDAHLVEHAGRDSLGRAIAGAQGAGEVFTATSLTPRWRGILTGLSGAGRVRVDSLVVKGMPLTAIDARIATDGGRLVLSPATLKVMGGTVSLAGTSANLRADPLSWVLVLDAKDLDVGQLLAPIKSAVGTASGALSLRGRFEGKGVKTTSILSSLSGPVTFTTKNVRVGAVDAVSQVVDRVWGALASLPGVDKTLQHETPRLGAALADGSWTLQRTRDRYRLDAPMNVQTTLGDFALTGDVGFDAKLDLAAKLALNQATRTALRLDAGKPLPLALRVRGPWDKAKVTLEDEGAVVAALREHLAQMALSPVADAVESLTGQHVERHSERGLFRSIEAALQQASSSLQKKVDADVKKTERGVDEALKRKTPVTP